MENKEHKSVLLFNGKVVVAEEGHVFELTQSNVNRSPKVQYLVSGELMTLFIIEHEARYGYLDMGLRGIFYTGKDDGKINSELFERFNVLSTQYVQVCAELERLKSKVDNLNYNNASLYLRNEELEHENCSVKELKEENEKLKENLKKNLNEAWKEYYSKKNFWQRLFNRKKY